MRWTDEFIGAVASKLPTSFETLRRSHHVASGLAFFGAARLWIATNTASTPYTILAGQMILRGGGLGLITAPATEAIMGVVPKDKAGVGSAVNDATRLFGAALGVAVIGSIAASLYGSHFGASIPHDIPPHAVLAGKGSLGGALVAAQSLGRAGLVLPARHLSGAAISAFLQSFAGSLRVAGAVALGGATMAAALLPSRPTVSATPVEAPRPDPPTPSSGVPERTLSLERVD